MATASGMPFGDDEPTNTAVRRPEDANPPDKAALGSDLRAVSLNYFQLLQVRLIQGRHFAPTDRAEAPRVALVNQTLARRLEASETSSDAPFASVTRRIHPSCRSSA